MGRVDGITQLKLVFTLTLCAAATPSQVENIRMMACVVSSRLSVCTVPANPAVFGVMLSACPMYNMITVNTSASTGLAERDTTACSGCTMAALVMTGSTAVYGKAACPPLPDIVTSNSAIKAMIGPGWIAKLPTGMLGISYRQ
jgi:hypothetical protein